MEISEFREIMSLALDDANAILHNQARLQGIHFEIHRSHLDPTEQAYVYLEHYGRLPTEPVSFTINGVSISSRILHQSGARLSDIEGGDLLYEIEDKKFAVIQYKRSAKTSVRHDRAQLRVLMRNCPEACSNKSRRPIPLDWVPSKVFSFCGIWYAVVDRLGTPKYVTACEAESIFQGKSSGDARLFQQGLSRNAFLDLFASCHIGALLARPQDIEERDSYVGESISLKRFVLAVNQSGRFAGG